MKAVFAWSMLVFTGTVSGSVVDSEDIHLEAAAVRALPFSSLSDSNVGHLDQYASTLPETQQSLLVHGWLQQASRILEPSETLRAWVESKQHSQQTLAIKGTDHPDKRITIVDIGAASRATLGIWLRRDIADEFAAAWEAGNWKMSSLSADSAEQRDATILWISGMPESQSRRIADTFLSSGEEPKAVGSEILVALAIRAKHQNLTEKLIASFSDHHTLGLLRMLPEVFEPDISMGIGLSASQQDYYASVAMNMLAANYGEEVAVQTALSEALQSEDKAWIAAAAVTRITQPEARHKILSSIPANKSALTRYIRTLSEQRDAS